MTAAGAADDLGGNGRRATASRGAPVGLATIDRHGEVLEMSAWFVELLGVPDAPLPVVIEALVSAEAAAAIRATVDAFRRTGEAGPDVEIHVVHADGAERWLLCKAFAVDLDDGVDDGTVGVMVVDVSQHKLGGGQHAALQRLTEQFAATVVPNAVAEVVIRAVRESVGASGGALYVLEDDVRLVAVRTGYPWPPGSPMVEVHIDDDMPVTRAVRERRAVWIRDEPHLLAAHPGIELHVTPGLSWGAHAALPIVVAGDVLGAMVFSWSDPRDFTDAERGFLDAVAAQCAQALQRAQLFERERAAREHTERVAEYVLRLERITGALAVASEPEAVIDRFLDQCLVEIGASYGAVLEVDAAKRALVPVGSRTTTAWTPRAVLLDGHGPLAQAVRTQRSVLLEDREQIRMMLGESIVPLAVEQAWAAVPLVAYGEILGVTALRYDGTRRFDADERAFLDRVGRRLAEAIERSRLYAHQRDAREQAEAAARWLRSVQSLAAALARSATRRDVARSLREHLHPATRADYSIVAALSADRHSLDVLTGTSTFAIATDQLGTTVQGAVREAILRGRSIELEDAEQIAASFPNLAAAGLRHFTLLPIRSGRSVIGVIGLGWSTATAVTADARRLLAIAVSLGGAAFERAAAYDLDHHIAETLQNHLLTVPEVEIPGMTWAARYAPGSVELTAGGDWYDLIELPTGKVALVVGDIVGHGIVAAAAMGQLRSATRALAVRDDPVGVLEALDAYVTTTGQGHLSSLALVVLDPVTGEAECALAGHPPPLLRHPDGSIHFIEAAHGSLLGIAPPGTRESVHVRLEPGSSIVLYTDGLIERRGESIDVGMARLGDAVADTHLALHPEGVCDRLLERLGDGGTAADDITLLVTTFEPLGDSWRISFPARLEMLRIIRTEVRAWLEHAGVDAAMVADIVLACDEACANSVEHGLRSVAPEVIDVSLALDGDIVEVVVSDPGAWSHRNSGDHRGRGLDIMRALMDDVDVSTGEGGTTVTMRRRRRA